MSLGMPSGHDVDGQAARKGWPGRTKRPCGHPEFRAKTEAGLRPGSTP